MWNWVLKQRNEVGKGVRPLPNEVATILCWNGMKITLRRQLQQYNEYEYWYDGGAMVVAFSSLLHPTDFRQQQKKESVYSFNSTDCAHLSIF